MCFSYPTSSLVQCFSCANTSVLGTAVQTTIATTRLKFKLKVRGNKNTLFLTCTISAVWFPGNPLGDSSGTSEQGLGVTTFTQEWQFSKAFCCWRSCQHRAPSDNTYGCVSLSAAHWLYAPISVSSEIETTQIKIEHHTAILMKSKLIHLSFHFTFTTALAPKHQWQSHRLFLLLPISSWLFKQCLWEHCYCCSHLIN